MKALYSQKIQFQKEEGTGRVGYSSCHLLMVYRFPAAFQTVLSLTNNQSF